MRKTVQGAVQALSEMSVGAEVVQGMAEAEGDTKSALSHSAARCAYAVRIAKILRRWPSKK